MSRRKRQPLPTQPVRAPIESLSHDGRGVAHVDGKAVFVAGALPGEEIDFVYTARSRRHDEGRVERVVVPSDERVEPRCAHADICGGCSLQHQAPERQILHKQRTLLDNLRRIGKVEPRALIEPLTGPYWGYRHKARLGVRYVHKKGRVLVGFREKQGRYLADLKRCEVLHPAVGARLDELAHLIQGLDAREHIAQIEVAVGDDVGVLVFRNLVPLGEADTNRLIEYARATGLHIQLQPAGPDSVQPLYPAASRLTYRLPDEDLTFEFLPTDFTQVNPEINRRMVAQALRLLAPEPDDRVLDLFCGLGNFTLPIARRAGHVMGVEGDTALVQRAWTNAQTNGIENVHFAVADLTLDPAGQSWLRGPYDKVLVDPPRSGALEMMPHLAALKPARLLYVSCHPGSLARDAGLLANEFGFRLEAAGVMDMFPHTTHVESMALFMR